MSGRSLLSSEVLTSKLESVNHDEQTLDIREIESKVATLAHSSSYYRGATLPSTDLFEGREFFVTSSNKSYRLKTVDPLVWVVIDDITTTLTSKEYVDSREVSLQSQIDLKLDESVTTPLSISLLGTSTDTEVRTLISAAKSGSISDSGITQNTNKFLGRLTAGNGSIEELSSAIPFIPAKSITRNLIDPSAINKYKKLWKILRGTNTYLGVMALTEQNTLVSWGRAGDSKLGVRAIGDVGVALNTVRFSPKIPAGEYVVDFQCAGQNSFAVLSNGWVYSCGTNGYSALGHGNTLTYTYFTRINWFIANGVEISQVETDGSRVSQDAVVTFYVSKDRHKLYVTGYNGYGQLGIGSIVNATVPTLSKDLGIDTIKKVASGGGYVTSSYLLTDSGVLYSTGYNGQGSCGNGTLVNVLTWIQMATNVDDFECTAGFTTAAGAGGACHIVVRKFDGTFHACGYNGYGQLGLGNTTNALVLTQVPVPASSSLIFGCSGGSYAWTYRVTNEGQLQVCGYNGQSQFGQGNATNLSSLTLVTNTAENLGAPPPFDGKIKLICHNGASNGHGNILLLDTDERLWFSGHDYQLYVVDTAAAISRFTEVYYNLDHPDEKIIDIKFNGYDGTYSHHFLSDHGKIYGMGYSAYGTVDGNSVAGNLIPNPTRGIFKLLRGA